MLIIRIIINRNTHILSCFHQTVDTNGQILAVDGDISSVKQRQHTLGLQVFKILIISRLHLMHQIDHLTHELQMRDIVLVFVLDTTVDVDGEHALGTG